MLFKEGDHVIKVVPGACEIEHERFVSVDTKSEGCEHGALDTFGTTFAHDASRRETGRAVGSLIDRDRIKKILNFARRI